MTEDELDEILKTLKKMSDCLESISESLRRIANYRKRGW